MAGSIALQGTPSGITFTSSTTGSETCILSATNPFGISASVSISVTFAPQRQPVSVPAPVLTVTRANGLPMKYPGTTGSVWSSTDAMTVTFGCTSTNGGFTLAPTSMGVSGSGGGATLESWVGKTSSCTWTATGAGGTAVYTETLTTINTPPTISVARTPLPFTAGQNHSITWSTTNATSVNQVCTSTGTGYTFSGSRPLSGGNTGVANPAWVGYPTHCVWTATGLGGTATAIDDFSTLPASLVQVYRMRTPGGIYYYTYNVSERDALTAAYGWVTEGAVFKIYAGASDIAGLFPAYRFNNDFGGHFWTISESEKATVISSIPQYHYEGIGWYAVGSAISGSIPLYRLYNGNTSTHFYTTSIVERDWIMANLAGWSNNGATMYVWP